MKNLDLLAAQAAQKIIADTEKQKSSEVENLITKSLGVLQENGVYAGMLYLYSRTNANDKPIAMKTRENLLSLTSVLGLAVPESSNPSTSLKFLTDNICNDLDRLLLVK